MITISSASKQYRVHFEIDFGFIHDISETVESLYVIDSNVYRLYSDLWKNIPEDRLYILEATEENKTIDTALQICEMITGLKAKRNATLVSVGGGIVQDITGFVSNITYRGINWVFVPTTLLAACDSCIGGKTSLNYHKFKNLLGTFYPPDDIYICPEFFMTLTDRDYKSGLGEVTKFNIMKGMKGLNNIERDISGLLSRDNMLINQYVRSSLEFKRQFIEVDEFDRGERILLNFAHTFGHAIEVISKYGIPHGTAVAIGMIMADAISLKRGYLSSDIEERARRVLDQVIDIDPNVMKVPIDEYLNAMRKDKKQTDDSLTTVLITKYGEEGTLEIVKDTTIDEIQDAIDYFLTRYEG